MRVSTPPRLKNSEANGALAIGTLSIALGAVPVFLLGSLAVFIREEIGFSELRLGLLASAYYTASALASAPGGRLAERLGGRRGTAAAAVLTLMAMLALAAIGRSWTALLVCMVFAGIGNGIALPASNLVLARGVPPSLQGLAFGIKQSSGPIATLVAGAAVPLVALTIGWRWAFVLVGLAALPVIAAGRSPSDRPPERVQMSGSVPITPLVALAIGAAAAVVGGSSIASFYVESAVAGGLSPAAAGTLLAVGSVMGILFRISWGWVAGRWHSAHIPLLGVLLVVGSFGFYMFGQVQRLVPMVLVTLLTFSTGWAWPAIYNFAIVVRTPVAPAFATGITATGLYSGGIFGPVLFGAIVEARGYETAWLFVSVCVAVGGVLIFMAGRSLERRVAIG